MTQSQLPVYQKARLLVDQLHLSSKHLPVWAKKHKLQECLDAAFDIMYFVAFANKAHTAEERAEWLEKAIETLEQMEVKVRILHDLGYITASGFGAIIKYEANVAKQLEGWLKKTRSSLRYARECARGAQP